MAQEAACEVGQADTKSRAKVLGHGAHRYEVIEDWGTLPPGWSYGEVAAVGVDSRDNVFVFSRGEHPMTVFDRAGNFLRSWGEGLFARPHGIHVAPDDTLWCTDDGDHTVRHMTADGRMLLQIGVPGEPAPYMSGDPLHRCTHTALSPEGDLYVADGYGNARVHKYTPLAWPHRVIAAPDQPARPSPQPHRGTSPRSVVPCSY
jgi:hypothetical protein